MGEQSRPGEPKHDLDQWADIQKKIDELLAKEPIQEAGYRALIFASQMGFLFRIYIHDPKVNMHARPVAEAADEVNHAGDALIQCLLYLRSRGLDLKGAYNGALERMEQQVWRKEVSHPGASNLEVPEGAIAAGICASPGEAEAPLLVVSPQWNGSRVAEQIRSAASGRHVILALSEYPDSVWKSVHENFHLVKGLLLKFAGTKSHPANLCNDYHKPCLVGIVGYENLRTSEIVLLEGTEEGAIGTVKLNRSQGGRSLQDFEELTIKNPTQG